MYHAGPGLPRAALRETPLTATIFLDEFSVTLDLLLPLWSI